MGWEGRRGRDVRGREGKKERWDYKILRQWSNNV